jgi:hypothetical protein
MFSPEGRASARPILFPRQPMKKSDGQKHVPPSLPLLCLVGRSAYP